MFYYNKFSQKFKSPDGTGKVIWHQAEGAMYYELQLLVFYGIYVDDATFVTIDTTVTIDGTWFSQSGGYTEFLVKAINGTEMDNGGNVKDNGNRLLAWNTTC